MLKRAMKPTEIRIVLRDLVGLSYTGQTWHRIAVDTNGRARAACNSTLKINPSYMTNTLRLKHATEKVIAWKCTRCDW